MYLSSVNGTFLVTKSMPMVGLVSSANDSPWHRAKMLDFPTPEFPITTTFAIATHCIGSQDKETYEFVTLKFRCTKNN